MPRILPNESELSAISPKQQQRLFLEKKYKPLVLCFDHKARLTSWYGNLAHFGLSKNINDKEATELFPFLVGMDMQKSNELPYVNLSNGQSADVLTRPDEQGFSLLLVDSSEHRAGHEKIQQVANEVSLLNNKLEALTSELEQKNAELIKANQAKSEFIAGMSHEFRTPIVSILGHSAWLTKQISATDPSIKNVETIERSAKFLLTLIDNLLRQGEITANRLCITKIPTEINDFIHSILQIIQPLADEKKLSLRKSVVPARECNCYLIDKHHLQQVLINLLANAVKFTREGEVCLSVECDAQQLTLEVTDTGIGIPPDSLEDILLPFTRAKNARSFQGAGLGLSIAKEIISNMGGHLHIHSSLDEGTRVLMNIPTEPAICVKTKSKLSVPSTHSRPVLLMEDNHDIVSIYELFFKEAGVDLTSVTDPSKFFDSVQNIHPHMLIIDYHLGETTGIDLVRNVRNAGFKGKIIMLTATSDIDDHLQREALSAGCDRFMTKPADVKSLVSFVQSEIS